MTQSILEEVLAERARQNARWGEQNHPDVDPELTGRVGGCSVALMADECGIAPPWKAKAATDRSASLGRCTWALIAVEELSEAIEAATLLAQGRGSTEELRGELVQTAAVLVQWIEALDRRSSRG